MVQNKNRSRKEVPAKHEASVIVHLTIALRVLFVSTSLAAGTRTIQAARKFSGHTAVVEDVAWHRHSPHIFASCGDDRLVALWDVRDASNTTPRLRIPAGAASGHKDDVMSLSFNPYQEFLLLTGSVDKTVKLWDTRNLAKALHTFAAHADEVLNGEC